MLTKLLFYVMLVWSSQWGRFQITMVEFEIIVMTGPSRLYRLQLSSFGQATTSARVRIR